MTSFEDVHVSALRWIPSEGYVLDIGSGSGRDAAALARRGLNVVAVEPSRKLRAWAKHHHKSTAIEWIDDRLPGLSKIANRSFNFVLLSAVWQHIPNDQRPQSLKRITSLLEKDGVIVLGLWDDPASPVSLITDISEIEQLVKDIGLMVISQVRSHDVLRRSDVRWATVILGHFDPKSGLSCPLKGGPGVM